MSYIGTKFTHHFSNIKNGGGGGGNRKEKKKNKI